MTALALVCALFSVQQNKAPVAAGAGRVIVFEDFESGFADWSITGSAFGTEPARGTLPAQSRVTGVTGERLANSFVGGDDTVGKAVSKTFTIEQPYISLSVGGGSDSSKTLVKLVVDGQTGWQASGKNSETLEATTWYVGNWRGRKAHFEIIDNARGPWGHVLVDQIEFRDSPRMVEQKPTRHNYLLVPVYFDDTAQTRPHAQEYYKALIGDTWPGMNWYFKTASGGRANLDGSVVWNWTRLPGKAVDYATAPSAGVNSTRSWDFKKLLDGLLASYPDRVRLTEWYGVAFCPNVLDEFGGGAATWIDHQVGSRREMYPVLFLNHTQGQSVWAHEMSHHFGIGHIGNSSDGDPEDAFSVMSFWGVNHPQYGGVAIGHTAFHKIKVGWLPSDRVVRLLPNGDSAEVQVCRLGGTMDGSVPLTVVIPEDGEGRAYYTVEVRRFGGEDLKGGLPSEGVVIHRIDTTHPDREASLQKRQAGKSPANSVWLPGQVFHDGHSRITVDVVKESAIGYVVRCTTKA